MKNINVIKVLGIGATVLGIGANLLADYVGKKELDEKVAEKVAEALSKTVEK